MNMDQTQMQMQDKAGLTMDQKHIVLATGSFLLGGLVVWFWNRRK